ncbi:auxin efflux carrier [Dipodascopsis uninucleata]
MALSIGASIYIAIKPIIKIFIAVSFGFYFARKGILDVHTCKKLSSLMINYFAPCIIFNKVLQAFDISMMKLAATCLLTGILFLVCGMAFGALVRYFTPVPKYWKGGAMVSTIWSNSGDIPMAYVMTITASSPFVSGDEDRGIAYVSILMSVSIISLFSFGGVQLVESDFNVSDDSSDDEVSDPEKGRQLPTDQSHGMSVNKLKNMFNFSKKSDKTKSSSIKEESGDEADEKSEHPVQESAIVISEAPDNDLEQDGANSLILTPVESAGVRSLRRRLSRASAAQAQALAGSNPEVDEGVALDPVISAVSMNVESQMRQGKQSVFIAKLILILKNLYQPPTASLIVAIVIAIISPVKRLFVVTDYDLSDAPDGKPILDFVMDFTSFIGQASVPLGLSLLGSSIGRLKINGLPKGFWKCIALIALLKLVVLPIIVIAWSQRMRSAGLLPEDNLIIVFVFVIAGACPTATSQFYLTAFFAPEEASRVKQMDCLASVLIFQYISLVFSLATVVTYTLKVVIGE